MFCSVYSKATFVQSIKRSSMTLDMRRKEKCRGVVKIIILHITEYLLLCTQYNEMVEKLFQNIAPKAHD